jgi:hypothetical protein
LQAIEGKTHLLFKTNLLGKANPVENESLSFLREGIKE